MPSITWSGSFNATSAGPNGRTATITSSSTLPSNASINSITCKVNVSAGWTSSSFYWTLHWFHVLSGSTTGAYIGTIGVNNSAGVSYQCDNVYSGGANRDVTATLTSSSTNIFKNYTSLTVNVKANIPQSGSPTTYMNAVSVTVNYSTPSINPPTLYIGGSSSYTGTFGRLKWDDASWSGGSQGTIKYRLEVDGYTGSSDVSSPYIYFSDSLAETFTFRIKCYSGSYSAYTNSVTFYFRPPTTPTLYVNGSSSYSGLTASLTWTASNIVGSESAGTTIRYDIRDADSFVTIATVTGTSYTYNPSGMSSYSTKRFQIYAYTLNPYSTSDDSNIVSYTYDPRQIYAPTLSINNGSSYEGPKIPLTWTVPQSVDLSGDITYKIYISNIEVTSIVNDTSVTIRDGVKEYVNVSIYITATRQGFVSPKSNIVTFTYYNPDKTFGYFNGSSFVDCVAYYYNGSSWIKCDPYYYNGSAWILISSRGL